MLNSLTESIDVVGVNRHDVTVLVSVKVANRKLLHASKELITKGNVENLAKSSPVRSDDT